MSTVIAVVTLSVVVPLLWELSREVRAGIQSLEGTPRESVTAWASEVPVVGQYLEKLVEEYPIDGTTVAQLFKRNGHRIFLLASDAARAILSTCLTLFGAIVISFFLFKDGASLARCIRSAFLHWGGETATGLLDTAHVTIKGAAYSVLLTALAQGALAGIGYKIAGAPFPVLLGFSTCVVSLIPFGPPFLYLPVSLYLFMTGSPWYVAGTLALWGALVVSTIDNLLRSLFISHATQMRASVVFVGVVGGVFAFGLLGVFVGPTLLAVVGRAYSSVVPIPATTSHT
jgi:predicted PurR-regulated permease PerM